MKRLTDIIENLPSDIIKKTLTYYKGRSKEKTAKRIELLEAVLNGREVGRTSSGSFSHLKRRVRIDILNVLLQQSPDRIYKNLFAQTEVKVNKRIILAKILANFGLYSEAEKMLSDCLILAERFELVDECVRILELERSLFAFRDKSYNHFDRLELIKTYRIIQNDYHKACDAYYSALIDETFLDTSENLNIRKHLIELEKVFQKTSMVRVGLMYYVASIRYHDNKKDYAKALSLSLEVKGLVCENEIVGSRTNTSRINGEIAQYYLFFKEFEKSKRAAFLSYKYSSPKSQARLMAIESLFKCSFFMLNLNEGREELLKALDHPIVINNIAYRAKWSYFEACQLFYEKSYKASLSVLNLYVEKHGVSFDKEGWAFGVRLLKLLNLIEIEKISEFEKSLRNLKEFLSGTELNSRGQLILKALSYVKNDLFFTKKDKAFEILRSLQGKDCEWDPLSFELVNFTLWFEHRLKK